MSLFSVIIPLYNKADTIERALKSVRAQTHHDFEVVVVDDGSTDNSAEIVERFEGLDRLRLIRQENAGVSAARNRGVEVAQGEYAAFLDADDYWDEDYLKTVAEVISKMNRPVIAGTGFYWVQEDRTWKTVGRGRIAAVDFISECAIFQPMHTSSVAVRREEFLSVGGFDVRHGFYEDLELLFKLALRFPRRVAMARSAHSYHMGDAGFSITKTLGSKERTFPHVQLLEDVLGGRADSRSVCRFARRYFARRFASNFLHGASAQNKVLRQRYPNLVESSGIAKMFLAQRLLFPLRIFSLLVVGYYWACLRIWCVRPMMRSKL